MSSPADSVEGMTEDAAQRAVVTADADASGVIVGAPGTGKTTALIERVVHLLDGGLAPEQVLALTPSRQAATGLRDRIGVRIGQATPGPLARSVGSFAFQLVRGAMVRAGDDPPALLTGADQDRIIAELLAGDLEDGTVPWPDALGPSVRSSKGFRSELRAFLAECTELGVQPGELPAAGDEVWAAAGEFLDDYHRVLAQLRSAHRDAADLLAEATGILHSAGCRDPRSARRAARRADRRRTGAHPRRRGDGARTACARHRGAGLRRPRHLLRRFPRCEPRAVRPARRRSRRRARARRPAPPGTVAHGAHSRRDAGDRRRRPGRSPSRPCSRPGRRCRSDDVHRPLAVRRGRPHRRRHARLAPVRWHPLGPDGGDRARHPAGRAARDRARCARDPDARRRCAATARRRVRRA
ncbi:UvrD-helicase domain-containing protein [Microbacterium sp. KUDC0406]|uniref:UvrD-helicase domain-containing protein n=1 Tax=Microbacterium sp. KUDC0406 TaxID=2909588 RepID=UPI002E349215|nr:UvrD-helicase domain-containing protein [Microbacterium sp. KUDC0406]